MNGLTFTRKTTENYDELKAKATAMYEALNAEYEKIRDVEKSSKVMSYKIAEACKRLGFEVVDAYTKSGYREPERCFKINVENGKTVFVRIK